MPTLRNIARTAPCGHNGYFENLEYDFLSSRDLGSLDLSVGHLDLDQQSIDDLVAFLGTLSDE